MSIVWSLKKLFDPQSHYYEEGEKHAERELPKDADSGDPPHFHMSSTPGQPATAGPAARFRCRVCGYTSAQDAYCPDCLADTMTAETSSAAKP